MKTVIISIALALISYRASSQLLITWLLGDYLNTGKIEFGLEGGIDRINLSNTLGAKARNSWNLGFYFDFKMKERLFFHTGCLVKSDMGAGDMSTYSVNNAYIDSAFVGGTVKRTINYFNVPALLRYRFYDYFHVEGGIMLGLQHKADDAFTKNIYEDEDLTFKNHTENNYTKLDAGLMAGVGYKFFKGKGMTLSTRYYYGLVDVDKMTKGSQLNSALYINASIKIGEQKKDKSEKIENAENN